MPEPMWPTPGGIGTNADGGEHTVRPARFILLEDAWPLRTESRPLIDLSVFLCIPPDIALARRLERDLLQGEPPLPIVRQYLTIGRRYNEALTTAATHADITLDATRPPDELVDAAAEGIRHRFGPM